MIEPLPEPEPKAEEPQATEELGTGHVPKVAPGINNTTSLGMKAALAIAFGEKQKEVEGTKIEQQPFPTEFVLEKNTALPKSQESGGSLSPEEVAELIRIYEEQKKGKTPAKKAPVAKVHPALSFRPGAANSIDRLSNDFLSKPAIRAWEDEE